MPCWICGQKKEYRQSKLATAQQQACEQSKQTGKTMAIIKNGCIYEVVPLSEVNNRVVTEYINADTG